MSNQNIEQLVQESLQWRYATKRFDPNKAIDSKTWSVLEESLRMAPSSFGLQPWHWIVVTDRSTREQLQAYSWKQPQVVEASHLVVLASAKTMDEDTIDSFLRLTAQTRSIAVENLANYRGMIIPFIQSLREQGMLESWTTRQVYLALGMLLSSAALMRIDACPLEGIDPTGYNKILGLETSNYSACVACALGYRSPSDATAAAVKVRYPHSKVFSYRS